MHLNIGIKLAAVALAIAAVAPQPAAAALAVEGGAFFGSGKTNLGATASLDVFNPPVIPVSAQLTVAVPFGNQGYATTLDGRFHAAGFAVGAGIGFGSLGTFATTQRTSTIEDAFIAKDVAPHTALTARVYFGNNRPSTVFGGVRFAL